MPLSSASTGRTPDHQQSGLLVSPGRAGQIQEHLSQGRRRYDVALARHDLAFPSQRSSPAQRVWSRCSTGRSATRARAVLQSGRTGDRRLLAIPTKRLDRHARPPTPCRRSRRPFWTKHLRKRLPAANSRCARRRKRATQSYMATGLPAAEVPVAFRSVRSRRNTTRLCISVWPRRAARSFMRRQQRRMLKLVPTAALRQSASSDGTAARGVLPAKSSSSPHTRSRPRGCC